MDIKKLQESYINWLKNKYTFDKFLDDDGKRFVYEIDTPFLNNIDDNFRFYITINKDILTIDDDGETIDNLKMLGMTFTDPRNKELYKILKQFNLKINNEIISTTNNLKEFPKMENNFINALIKIDSMIMLKKDNIKNIFYSDVYNFFNKYKTNGIIDYNFKDSSGLKFYFNYYNKFNNIAFDFKNHISFSNITKAFFKNNSFNSSNLQYNIIYNDKVAVPNKKIKIAANNSNIQLISFNKNNKNKLISKI